jgi:hypothetical protein
MSESFDLDRIVTEVRAAAKECDALIVEAIASVDTGTVPVAAIVASRFPSLIKHVKPRLIYLVASPFDAGDETLAALEVEDDSFLERSSIKKLISRWRYRNGQTCRVVLSVMCDGVMHGILEEADWLAEFEGEVQDLMEELEQAREDGERKLDAEEKKRLAPQVKRLMADPRFSAPKVGVAKRTALAEALFPDLDRTTLRAIVERAETDHWLATARQ